MLLCIRDLRKGIWHIHSDIRCTAWTVVWWLWNGQSIVQGVEHLSLPNKDSVHHKNKQVFHHKNIPYEIPQPNSFKVIPQEFQYSKISNKNHHSVFMLWFVLSFQLWGWPWISLFSLGLLVLSSVVMLWKTSRKEITLVVFVLLLGWSCQSWISSKVPKRDSWQHLNYNEPSWFGLHSILTKTIQPTFSYMQKLLIFLQFAVRGRFWIATHFI